MAVLCDYSNLLMFNYMFFLQQKLLYILAPPLPFSASQQSERLPSWAIALSKIPKQNITLNFQSYVEVILFCFRQQFYQTRDIVLLSPGFRAVVDQ